MRHHDAAGGRSRYWSCGMNLSLAALGWNLRRSGTDLIFNDGQGFPFNHRCGRGSFHHDRGRSRNGYGRRLDGCSYDGCRNRMSGSRSGSGHGGNWRGIRSHRLGDRGLGCNRLLAWPSLTIANLSIARNRRNSRRSQGRLHHHRRWRHHDHRTRGYNGTKRSLCNHRARGWARRDCGRSWWKNNLWS